MKEEFTQEQKNRRWPWIVTSLIMISYLFSTYPTDTVYPYVLMITLFIFLVFVLWKFPLYTRGELASMSKDKLYFVLNSRKIWRKIFVGLIVLMSILAMLFWDVDNLFSFLLIVLSIVFIFSLIASHIRQKKLLNNFKD